VSRALPRPPSLSSWLVRLLCLGSLVVGCAAERAAGPAPAAPPEAADDRERQGPEAAIAHAKGDFDVAERELLASAGDCAAACRALGSMERATTHLCALAQADDDRARCDEAKGKVLAARAKVRTTCGVCEGGPSLDKTAPIPSVAP
jgi:hypothetical protein